MSHPGLQDPDRRRIAPLYFKGYGVSHSKSLKTASQPLQDTIVFLWVPYRFKYQALTLESQDNRGEPCISGAPCIIAEHLVLLKRHNALKGYRASANRRGRSVLCLHSLSCVRRLFEDRRASAVEIHFVLLSLANLKVDLQ